jgi:hypothetical protein
MAAALMSETTGSKSCDIGGYHSSVRLLLDLANAGRSGRVWAKIRDGVIGLQMHVLLLRFIERRDVFGALECILLEVGVIVPCGEDVAFR